MRRTSTLSFAVAALLLTASIDVRSQEPRRPRAPALTSEDVLTPRSVHPLPDESISRTSPSGAPLRNARTVLESALTKMGEINSLRTRLQASMPTGQREVMIESIKPDRAHIVSSDGEMIVIGRKFYMKNSAGWQVTSLPAGGAQSDSGLDFRTIVKQLIGKPGVRVTGQVLGTQSIDGVDAIAYEFAITDGSETGTIQLSVGKEDGYMRRMALSGGALGIKVWFTDINEQFSIDPPM
jgi:hypothetical protein